MMFPRSSQRSPPEKSVMSPPASLTSSDPAATSHAARCISKNPSKIPAAVGEVERRRTGTANALGHHDDVAKDAAVDVDVLLRTEREAGRQERALHRTLGRHRHPRAVSPRTRSALGRKDDVAQRLVDDAGDDLVARLQTDRDRPDRQVL